MSEILQYVKSDNYFRDVCHIIDDAQQSAYRAVDTALVLRNWDIGKRINEEILSGQDREKCRARIIQKLASELTDEYGKRYSKSFLYQCLRVYRMFPSIANEAGEQLRNGEKVDGFHSRSGILSWTHYRILTQVEDAVARGWYAREAYVQAWSVTTLQNIISSQYYYRMLKTQGNACVENETKELTSQYQNKLEFTGDPVIAEFLGFQEDASHYELDLEESIIDALQKYFINFGKGYALVARQQRIHTEKEDCSIDFVFYNYILKCFVLIDLKTEKITYQDIGQMDVCIRMYDELKKQPDDGPTLGIVLCADTHEEIVRYSVFHGNEQLFASKYKQYLPAEEELRAEIEIQEDFYYLNKVEEIMRRNDLKV